MNKIPESGAALFRLMRPSAATRDSSNHARHRRHRESRRQFDTAQTLIGSHVILHCILTEHILAAFSPHSSSLAIFGPRFVRIAAGHAITLAGSKRRWRISKGGHC
jgi:hypothetical protein